MGRGGEPVDKEDDKPSQVNTCTVCLKDRLKIEL